MTSDVRYNIQQIEEIYSEENGCCHRSSYLRLDKYLNFEWIERPEHANRFTKGEAAGLLFALNQSVKENQHVDYYVEDADERFER